MINTNSKEVVVVGGGPVGLLCALYLANHNISVCVIESEPQLTVDLRAGTFHPPTLEMLDTLGITEIMLKQGIKVPLWQSRDLQEGLIVEWDMDVLKEDTDYPFRLHLEQHRLTPIIYDLLTKMPHVEILFSHQLLDLTQHNESVALRIDHLGNQMLMDAKWVIGADGGKSVVRKSCQIEFDGYTWPEKYSVISTNYDISPLGYADNAYISDPEQWIAFFRMPDTSPPGLWRMTVPVSQEIADEDVLSNEYANHTWRRSLSGALLTDIPIIHQSIYRVHQRVAKNFRKQRVLLAGDAAHVNNPLGGFGLNSGIHDALNLSEKLTQVIKKTADESILDLYERQRKSINLKYVQEYSIQNKRNLEEKDPLVRRERFELLKKINAKKESRREFLLNSSMINSIKSANLIT
jgi:3-(3-hydroxy-phenyl)propionate hydroxylase